jgi:predicted nucleotidyltransferase
MFRKRKSNTKDKELDSVIKILTDKSEVDSILVLGSVKTNDFKPYSDIDLVVVLDESVKPKLSSCFCHIGQNIGDIYFFYTDKIDKLISSYEKLDINSIEGKLVYWLGTGEILCDKNGRLKKLKGKQIKTEITDSRKYQGWFRINFNYAHNLRMFNSKDALYRQALEVRLLYTTMELLPYYLELRNIPWRGEKAAVNYFRESQPEFLGKFFACIRAKDLDTKFGLYSELVKDTLQGIGELWDETTAAIVPVENYSPQIVEKGIYLWNKLTKIDNP